MSENLIEIATGIIIGLIAGILVGLDAKKRGMLNISDKVYN